jgi:hypothetical protein
LEYLKGADGLETYRPTNIKETGINWLKIRSRGSSCEQVHEEPRSKKEV